MVAPATSRVASPAVGVLWDTHHPWRFLGEKIAETFERLRPWVRHTHFKDSVTESRVVECVPGERFVFEPFFRADPARTPGDGAGGSPDRDGARQLVARERMHHERQ